jgi:hypothetical protein
VLISLIDANTKLFLGDFASQQSSKLFHSPLVNFILRQAFASFQPSHQIRTLLRDRNQNIETADRRNQAKISNTDRITCDPLLPVQKAFQKLVNLSHRIFVFLFYSCCCPIENNRFLKELNQFEPNNSVKALTAIFLNVAKTTPDSKWRRWSMIALFFKSLG